MLVEVRGPVDWAPETATAPVHAPEAEQEVAFDDDQLSCEAAPLVTEVGLATTDAVTFNPVTGCRGSSRSPTVSFWLQAASARANTGTSDRVCARKMTPYGAGSAMGFVEMISSSYHV